MALPKDEAEHLKRLFIQLHNPRVKRHFKDIPDDDIVTQGKASLKTGCTIRSSDSLLFVLGRVLLFELTIGNASRMHPALYAIPVKQHYEQEEKEVRPKILLFFEQDTNAVPNGFSKIQAEITFRLEKETNATITESKAKSLARKIKEAFGSVPTFNFTKGDRIFSYQDKAKGYWLQIYADKDIDAETLVKKILSIQGHSFEKERFKVSANLGKKSINNPIGTRRVYGKQKKNKRWRPRSDVRFRYATLNCDGIDPIVLYDPYRRLRDAGLISTGNND